MSGGTPRCSSPQAKSNNYRKEALSSMLMEITVRSFAMNGKMSRSCISTAVVCSLLLSIAIFTTACSDVSEVDIQKYRDTKDMAHLKVILQELKDRKEKKELFLASVEAVVDIDDSGKEICKLFNEFPELKDIIASRCKKNSKKISDWTELKFKEIEEVIPILELFPDSIRGRFHRVIAFNELLQNNVGAANEALSKSTPVASGSLDSDGVRLRELIDVQNGYNSLKSQLAEARNSHCKILKRKKELADEKVMQPFFCKFPLRV